jgi:hypothetical protein
MAEQPHLFPPQSQDHPPAGGSTPQPVPEPDLTVAPKRQPSNALARIETMIRILVRLYLGVIVLALPWLSFWTQNNLFTYSPILTWLADSGFVRGMVSGLGLLNIIIAVIETTRSRVLS